MSGPCGSRPLQQSTWVGSLQRLGGRLKTGWQETDCSLRHFVRQPLTGDHKITLLLGVEPPDNLFPSRTFDPVPPEPNQTTNTDEKKYNAHLSHLPTYYSAKFKNQSAFSENF